MPKIEVFIPAYNCRATLARTLASLAAQSDPDFSVCVIDDCSNESFEDIYAMFPMLKLRLIRNEKNLGVGLSRQQAIDTSEADYLIPLDSDDMLLPMAIDIFRKSAIDKPMIDYFIGHVINESLDKEGHTVYSVVTDNLTIIASKMYKRSFLKKFNICNCEEFSRFADDTYFNILAYELGKISYIPFPLYLYTCNPNSVTNKNGGKDYWTGVVPKFIQCIYKTTELIVKHKPINEIKHLPGTLEYIRQTVMSRQVKEEIEQFFALKLYLEKCGYSVN